MPWKDARPMAQRVLFLADYRREICSFSELCARYAVSRKTGYKWVERYRDEAVRSAKGQILLCALPFSERPDSRCG